MTRETPSRGLKAGIFLPPFHANEDDPLILMEQDFELMQWLGKLGYGEAWIGEHHTAPWEPHPAPDLLIAQALMQTKRLRIGPGGGRVSHDDLAKALSDDEVERRKLSVALLPHVRKFYAGYIDPSKHQPFYRPSSMV
mgnify:CR=1 FL=1